MTFKKGGYCKFNIKTGVKTYSSKEVCDYAFEFQQKASEAGIAPPIIQRIDDLSFQTEIADTSFFMKNFKRGIYYNKAYPELHKKLLEIRKTLPKTPHKKIWGPDGIDLARHNLGIYNEKVVMIDFYP
jgi:hypothetical protein